MMQHYLMVSAQASAKRSKKMRVVLCIFRVSVEVSEQLRGRLLK